MKEFEFYIHANSVKKQAPDSNTARSSADAAIDRLRMAKNILNKEKPKYVLENAYEAIREYIDSILFAKGYKSFSHEATIAYLSKIGFTLSEVNLVDMLRRKRIGTKYYGSDATVEEAKDSLIIAEKIIEKLKKYISF